MDLVLVTYHPNWFFFEVLWVIYVICISVFVCCVVCADLPDASDRS